ncbi:MAG: gliding motility-associated ABC transporter ATP-binding subunit GldA [Bacteroidetes bacterium]|nr:MAG: gliding motility-associated ABC transporter ATP-binding subunit GldA [Bacteroidota bacterium]
MATIEAQNISKYYGKQKALSNINLTIKKGEVVGLLGPNGAGKSTLMKILTSFLPPTSGTALINGVDVQEASLDIRKLIGYLPENNPLYTDMYVKEYLRFVFDIYKNPGNPNQAVDRLIDLTGLQSEYKKKIGALSKGYRQRVGLAQALIHDPEILIFDEPTSGLDPNQLIGIRKIITDLGKEKTVILSTHIMQEVEAVCDRVIIIDKGRIVADDATINLFKMAGNKQSFRVEFKEQFSENILNQLPFIDKVQLLSKNEWLIESKDNKDIREDLFKFAVANNYNVLSLIQEEQKMEDVFRRLTEQ